MKWCVIYEVDIILGFLGQVCYCGEDHWKAMDWVVGEAGIKWPTHDLGVDRHSVISGIQQLKRI